MASDIRLIQEIEKHEIIYNTSLPEYTRKDLTDEAWAKVSQNTDLTVNECKDKWRNIRCCLLRSLKPSKKSKKPYYLASYLLFVVPFMKPLNSKKCIRRIQSSAENNLEHIDLVTSIKVEEESEESSVDTIDTELSDTKSLNDPLFDQPDLPDLRRKRINVAYKREFKRNKQEDSTDEQEYNAVIDTSKSKSESMKYFLMSLLPEFNTMTEEQSRLLKIKVMMLLDDIKSNNHETKQNISSSSNSGLLQK